MSTFSNGLHKKDSLLQSSISTIICIHYSSSLLLASVQGSQVTGTSGTIGSSHLHNFPLICDLVHTTVPAQKVKASVLYHIYPSIYLHLYLR
jgi:hypothetical protein